jgi:hypothetical protein
MVKMTYVGALNSGPGNQLQKEIQSYVKLIYKKGIKTVGKGSAWNGRKSSLGVQLMHSC